MLLYGGAGTVAAQQKTIPMGPYFQTLQQDQSIADSIERGQQIFNQLGCGGCHPRGGTIGGTALNVAGQRVPVPVPALTGAALHYPRLSMTGFAATIGIMNDL
jgi:hypothetical protein